MVSEVTERALVHTEKEEILLTGGVAANRRLQSMIKAVADEHSVECCLVPRKFAVDNGAMVAWTGVLAYANNVTTPIDGSLVKPRWRLEEVEIPWVK
jgi:N6-L-threonylcarbamoyladenine synthase